MIDITVIAKRLAHFGYAVTEADNDQLDFEINKIITYAKNYCNLQELPECVEPRLIDRICSEFLFYKKNAGLLEGFDYDAVVKQIKEGDTTLQFAVGQGEDTPESRFDALVKQLERGCDKWLTPHRRLRW